MGNFFSLHFSRFHSTLCSKYLQRTSFLNFKESILFNELPSQSSSNLFIFIQFLTSTSSDSQKSDDSVS